jgi:hypothetical protein
VDRSIFGAFARCCVIVPFTVFLVSSFSFAQTQELDHLQTEWVSQNLKWFGGYRYGNPADPYHAPDNSVTTGSELGLYHGQIVSVCSPSASVPVEVRFGVASSQNAYRLRRSGPAPEYAYEIQSANPYVALPFSVWDVSDPSNPRQLTMAWRDQSDDGIWNPSVGNDDVEVVFIYHKSYDPTGETQFSMPPDAILDEATIGEKADIMYALSLQVLQGHVLNESAGTYVITPHLFVPVSIVIKEGSVNCQNPKEVIPVAILTTPGFDPAQLDISTVRFGWNNAPEMHGTAHVQDVDGDGDNDLLFHFLYSQTGIMCDEEQAMLFGRLYSGEPIRGIDAIHFITPAPTFKGATGIHDGNDVILYVAPNGHLAYDGETYWQGNYPKKTPNQYIFDAGPWVGGIVDGTPIVAEVQHATEFVPSQIGNTENLFRVFNSSIVTDKKSWPPEFSAPSGDPIIVQKAQNLVVEYNDLHGTPLRDVKLPLGVEIRQRSLAYGDAAKRSALIFIWEIKNVSTNMIQDGYFGFWADIDIGAANDDFTSTVNDMSIIWDSEFAEATFTEKPAIVAFDFLETPGEPRVRNYTAFTNGGPNSDPRQDGREYAFLSGALHFETNWRGDVRSLLSTGPFNLASGQKVLVAGALLFARVPVATAWLMTDPMYPFRPIPEYAALSPLLQLQKEVRAYYDVNLKGKGLPKGGMQDETAGSQAAPTQYELFQNYPNPFNPVTAISYELLRDGHVTLKLYNMLGQEVAVLVDGEQTAGYKSVEFNATDLPSGTYIYRLTAGDFVATKKLTLLK